MAVSLARRGARGQPRGQPRALDSELRPRPPVEPAGRLDAVLLLVLHQGLLRLWPQQAVDRAGIVSLALEDLLRATDRLGRVWQPAQGPPGGVRRPHRRAALS